jgi:hypothetical protein
MNTKIWFIAINVLAAAAGGAQAQPIMKNGAGGTGSLVVQDRPPRASGSAILTRVW